MKKGLIQGLVLSSLTVGMAACSGGGGGSGAGGSTSKVASGALAMPSLNCGTSPCLSSGASLLSAGVNSSEEIGAYGELAYTHFNDVALPKINELLYTLETEFKDLGFDTCAEIEGIAAATGVPLDTTYSVDITASGLTSPFTGATTKTFVIKQSGTAIAKISIGCSGTVRNLYVKALADSTHRYEIWVQTDSGNTAVKSVEAAADVDSAKLTLQFVSSSATAFTLSAAGESYPNPYSAGTINFAMFGQANLGVSPKIAHIAYTSVLSSPPPTSYSANDSTWSGTPIRHCYSNFATGAVDSVGTACSTLSATSPTTSGVRGNVAATPIAWQVDDLDTAISTSF